MIFSEFVEILLSLVEARSSLFFQDGHRNGHERKCRENGRGFFVHCRRTSSKMRRISEG